VKDYLVARGIDPSRLEAKGYGESAPVDSNETPEGRELNRRVEMKMLDAAAPAQ
jgi:OOP family OmpA-OmpF porin